MSPELHQAIESFLSIILPIIVVSLAGFLLLEVKKGLAVLTAWLDVRTTKSQRDFIAGVTQVVVGAAKQSGLLDELGKEGNATVNKLTVRAQEDLASHGWHVDLGVLESLIRDAISKR